MTDKTHTKRQELEIAIKQKQAQIQDLNARERVRQRKQDTRRKIVLGGLILDYFLIDDDFKSFVKTIANDQLINERDRKLFDLPPIK